MRGISCLAANRLAAQEGLCTVEWVLLKNIYCALLVGIKTNFVVIYLHERLSVTCSVVLSAHVSTGLEEIITIRVFGLLSQVRAQESPTTGLALMSTWVGEGSLTDSRQMKGKHKECTMSSPLTYLSSIVHLHRVVWRATFVSFPATLV